MATIIRTDVWMLARELAEALEQTPEVLSFKQAEDALLTEPEALALVDGYEAAKRAVKFSKGKSREEQAALIETFMSLEERFNAHPLIQRYADARDQVDLLLERVNMVITYPLTGKEAPARKVGCGSGGGGGGGCGCGA